MNQLIKFVYIVVESCDDEINVIIFSDRNNTAFKF